MGGVRKGEGEEGGGRGRGRGEEEWRRGGRGRGRRGGKRGRGRRRRERGGGEEGEGEVGDRHVLVEAICVNTNCGFVLASIEHLTYHVHKFLSSSLALLPPL